MSKTKIFLLQGKSSFSNSKLNQLNIAFNKLNKLDEVISSSEIFLISAYNNLDIDKLYKESNVLNFINILNNIPKEIFITET